MKRQVDGRLVLHQQQCRHYTRLLRWRRRSRAELKSEAFIFTSLFHYSLIVVITGHKLKEPWWDSSVRMLGSGLAVGWETLISEASHSNCLFSTWRSASDIWLRCLLGRCIPSKGFTSMPISEGIPGRPRTHWGGWISAGRGMAWGLPGRIGKC